MIFYCNDGREINFIQASPNDTERVHDFFLEDVVGIINGGKLDISDIYYIINLEPITKRVLTSFSGNPKRYTDIFVDMLKEFIEIHKDKFIIIRMGYDADNEKKESLRIAYKLLLTQLYPAAIKAGFIDISTISDLEYSKCLVYNNEVAAKFLEIASRYEIMSFIGDEFSYEDIFKAVNNTEK